MPSTAHDATPRYTPQATGRTRMLAIVLLVLSAIGDFAVAPVLLTTHDHRPPTVIPVLALICALASLAAAFGVLRRAAWAAPLGIASRAVDALAAVPAFFVGVGAGPITGAAVSIALSLATICLLLSLRRG